jgi:hypothetical protein
MPGQLRQLYSPMRHWSSRYLSFLLRSRLRGYWRHTIEFGARDFLTHLCHVVAAQPGGGNNTVPRKGRGRTWDKSANFSASEQRYETVASIRADPNGSGVVCRRTPTEARTFGYRSR